MLHTVVSAQFQKNLAESVLDFLSDYFPNCFAASE
jgi:hypothetical protein